MFRLTRLFSSPLGLTEIQRTKTAINVATNSSLFDELNNSLAARAELIEVEKNLQELKNTITPLQAQLTANISAEEVAAIREKILKHLEANGLFEQWQERVKEEFDTKIKTLLPGNSMLGKEWHRLVEVVQTGEHEKDVNKLANLYVDSLKQLLFVYVNEAEINARKLKAVRDYYNEIIVAFAMQNKKRKSHIPIRKGLIEVLNQNSHEQIRAFLTDKSIPKIDELMKIVAIINPESGIKNIKFDQVVSELQKLSDSYVGAISDGRGSTASLNYYFANTAEPDSPFNHVRHNAVIKTQFKSAYETYLNNLQAIDDLVADQTDTATIDKIISAIFSQKSDNLDALENMKAYLSQVSNSFVLTQAEWELILNVAKVCVRVEKTFAESIVGNDLLTESAKFKLVLQKQKTVMSLFAALSDFTTVIVGDASFLQKHMATLKVIDLLPTILHGYIKNLNAIAETEASLTLLRSEVKNAQANKEKLKQEIIAADIDIHAGNVLRNCYARAFQLCNENQTDETQARWAEISANLGSLTEQSVDQMDELIINLFEKHANHGIYGEGLLPNSFDTRLLQFLYNEGVPVGLFNLSLAKTQGAATDCLITLPVSELTGEVVSWQAGSLSKQARKEIRDTAKQNLRDMATLFAAYKQAFASNEKTMPLIVKVDNTARLLSDYVLPEGLTA